MYDLSDQKMLSFLYEDVKTGETKLVEAMNSQNKFKKPLSNVKKLRKMYQNLH